MFVLALTGNKRWIRNPWAMTLLFLPGAIFMVMVWTSHLVFNGFRATYWGHQEIGGVLRAPSQLYVVALFVIGVIILFRHWRHASSKRSRAGLGYVLLAAMVPLVAGLVTDVILPMAGIHMVEMPMFASTFIAPIIAYGMMRIGLMSTVAGSLGSEIITNINDSVIIANVEGDIETANPAAIRLTGYSSEELTGTPVEQLFIDSPRAAAHAEAPEGSEKVNWSLCASKSGEVIPVTRSSSEVLKKSGRLIGTVMVVHDMREALRLLQVEHEVKMVSAEARQERDRSEMLKHSEEEVRKLSRFLESVIENIAEPLFIQDTSFRYVFVNAAHRQLTGYDKNEILGKTDYELYWHEQADIFRDRVSRVFELGLGDEFPEISVVDKEGVPHITRTLAAPMKNDVEDVEFVVGTIKDLTEQKKLEGARLDFIRIAAHELRTPLTSLKLGFEMLARETQGALNPEQQRSLDILSLSIERLGKLSKNLLDLASMDAGLITLHMQLIDMGGLFNEAQAMFSSALREKGLEMVIDVPAGTRKATGDPSRLSQVLYNLVSNALKYTDEGTITMSVADGGGDMLHVSVSDTGSGIPAAAREAIFTRFVKAQSAETAKEGTGLGLSITKAIVEAHGGTIRVDSVLGQGSTFTFTVPAGDVRGHDRWER
jgi:PAS domain S-box-containing protein